MGLLPCVKFKSEDPLMFRAANLLDLKLGSLRMLIAYWSFKGSKVLSSGLTKVYNKISSKLSSWLQNILLKNDKWIKITHLGTSHQLNNFLNTKHFERKTGENTIFLNHKKWEWDNKRVREVLSDLSINAALCLMVEMVEKRVVLSPEKCPCAEISLLEMTPDFIVITILFIIVLTIFW